MEKVFRQVVVVLLRMQLAIAHTKKSTRKSCQLSFQAVRHSRSLVSQYHDIASRKVARRHCFACGVNEVRVRNKLPLYGVHPCQ